MATEEYSVLVVGGTGQTGSRLGDLLHAAGIPTLIASRSGKAPEGMTGTTLDWADEKSFSASFETAKDSGLPAIRAVYMVGPPLRDSVTPFKAFVQPALTKGVWRLVLLSSATVEEGGPHMGKPHALLKELGNEHKLEWAVVRPTWFQENFSRQGHHLASINQESKVYSTTGDGKIPFVSVDDIAACAKELLTTPDAPNSDYLILGQEPLSYGDVADVLSEVLGRKIVHADLSAEALEQRLVGFGFPAALAQLLCQMETKVRQGSEDRTNDVVMRLTGRKPKTLREYAEEYKAAWTQG